TPTMEPVRAAEAFGRPSVANQRHADIDPIPGGDMTKPTAPPLAVVASMAPPRTKASKYPEPFFSRMLKREKRPLGDLFGLRNFGVNLTRLAPGGESALFH